MGAAAQPGWRTACQEPGHRHLRPPCCPRACCAPPSASPAASPPPPPPGPGGPRSAAPPARSPSPPPPSRRGSSEGRVVPLPPCGSGRPGPRAGRHAPAPGPACVASPARRRGRGNSPQGGPRGAGRDAGAGACAGAAARGTTGGTRDGTVTLRGGCRHRSFCAVRTGTPWRPLGSAPRGRGRRGTLPARGPPAAGSDALGPRGPGGGEPAAASGEREIQCH